MTGFGRGTAERDGVRAVVDVRAVNHRFLDLKLRGSLAAPVEDAIGQRVRAAVERGSVTVSIHLQRAAATGPARIDHDAARAAHAQLARLAADLALPPPDLALVLAQPGVVVSAATDDDDEAAAAAILAALDAALAQLAAMRATEGAALQTELSARLDDLAQTRADLAKLADGVAAVLQRRLTERVAKLLGEGGAMGAMGAMGATGATGTIDASRLAQEVALLADRADITEELVRLESHLAQARALVAGTAPAGRRLDFLVQEIGRELNTVGSKSALADVTSSIVAAKATLEKLREQVQNVE
ncbi:MAG TPA: YicC/YloC family endoribonuclease [Kofleriaceae bacterium]